MALEKQANRLSSLLQVRKSDLKSPVIIQFLDQFKSILVDLNQKQKQLSMVIQSLKNKSNEKNSNSNAPIIITPKKSENQNSVLQNASFNLTSQIKTKEDFESISATNDKLYKQFEQIIEKYQKQKQTLNHENEIVLNQWLQNSSNLTPLVGYKNLNNKNGFFPLLKTLIQQLSKYESVDEYIASIELLQNQKAIQQLRATSSSEGQDSEKKWLKQATKSYMLRMADILRKQSSDSNSYGDADFLDSDQEELQHIF